MYLRSFRESEASQDVRTMMGLTKSVGQAAHVGGIPPSTNRGNCEVEERSESMVAPLLISFGIR